MNETGKTLLTESQCNTMHDNLYRRYVGEIIDILRKHRTLDVTRDELMIRVVATSLEELFSQPDDDLPDIEASDVLIDRLSYIDEESFLCEYTGTNFNMDEYVGEYYLDGEDGDLADGTVDEDDDFEIERIPGTESSFAIRRDGLHHTPWTGVFNMYSMMKLARHAAEVIESGRPAEEFPPFWIENMMDESWEEEFNTEIANTKND